MQDKFGPKFLGKNPTDFVVGMSDRVYVTATRIGLLQCHSFLMPPQCILVLVHYPGVSGDAVTLSPSNESLEGVPSLLHLHWALQVVHCGTWLDICWIVCRVPRCKHQKVVQPPDVYLLQLLSLTFQPDKKKKMPVFPNFYISFLLQLSHAALVSDSAQWDRPLGSARLLQSVIFMISYDLCPLFTMRFIGTQIFFFSFFFLMYKCILWWNVIKVRPVSVQFFLISTNAVRSGQTTEHLCEFLISFALFVAVVELQTHKLLCLYQPTNIIVPDSGTL
ncbi:hypothetical protein AB205_0112790 [Aquarana catesbeiana]|uniref:Uncharacterized protein n=1 Tax=Aquarana catesbeiana TaxID=8400 RepID=A0A2G9RC67_AQUCT|nr:hypothetical protein AB205_0112790 [Aquarana catesbeiana]